MFNLLIGTSVPIEQNIINLNLDKPVVQQQQEPQQMTYQVVEGDNLSKIAEKHGTTWQRLWAKNTQLTNQDQLDTGIIIQIPASNETLADRPLYSIPQQEKAPERPVISSQRVSSTANSYDYRSCTWWVKHWRPSVGNNWGNANNWGYAAQSQGWTVSNIPVVGAVAWSTAGYYGHVALVLELRGDAVLIQEGNYDFNGSVRTIEVPTSTYRYIY